MKFKLLLLLLLCTICYGQVLDTSSVLLPIDTELKILLELSKASENKFFDAMDANDVDDVKKIDREVETGIRLQKALINRLDHVIRVIEQNAERTGSSGSSSSSNSESNGEGIQEDSKLREDEMREKNEYEIQQEKDARMQSLREARERRKEELKRQQLQEALRREFNVRIGNKWGTLPQRYVFGILSDKTSEFPIEYRELVEDFLNRLMED